MMKNIERTSIYVRPPVWCSYRSVSVEWDPREMRSLEIEAIPDKIHWDLYVMWRTLSGLPIRPDKYSVVRGRYHNGEEAKDAWYTLSLDEAKRMVGLQ